MTARHDLGVGSENKSVVEFDEILSDVGAETQNIKFRGKDLREVPEASVGADQRMSWQSSAFGKVWNISSKIPKWFIPILVILGLVMGAVLLVIFLVIATPVILVRALIPRKSV